MNKLYAFAAAAALSACAAPAPQATREPLALLDDRPGRAHEVIGLLQARGAPGAHVHYAYAELRRKARALGADAVVRVDARKHTDVTPPPPQAPPDRLGRAYPAPLERFEAGALPSYGFDVQTAGVYYVVEGLAIRYLP